MKMTILHWRNINKLRVFFLVNFLTSYCRAMAGKRKGECLRCGTCCRTCTYQKENHECSVYSERPDWCRKGFPLDPLDLWFTGLAERCGYYWEQKCPACGSPMVREIRNTPTGSLKLWLCGHCKFVGNGVEA